MVLSIRKRFRTCIPLTHLSVCTNVDGIDHDQEDPEDETDDPCMPCCPKLEHKLRSNQIGRDGHRVVEPIVPRKSEAVRRGEEPRSICVEGT